MTLNEYQEQAITFDVMGDGSAVSANNPAYVAKILGLVGEAGEVAEKYKKIIRDKEGVVDSEDKAALIKELGDVLWYVSTIAQYLEVPFDEIAQANIEKLASRKSRGVQKGSGDNR